MDWTPGGLSGDIEDRRSEGGGGIGFGGGRGLGIGGLLILLVISLITGRNFIGAYLMGNSGAVQEQRPAAPPSAEEQRSAQLVSFVLDDAQKTWSSILPGYRHARLVLFRNATYSGCGSALLPAGRKGIHRPGFLERSAPFRRSGRLRTGLCHCARDRASRAEAGRHRGKGGAVARLQSFGGEQAF